MKNVANYWDCWNIINDLVPGVDGDSSLEADAEAIAEYLGFPVIINGPESKRTDDVCVDEENVLAFQLTFCL